jgi:hypothetical protein
LFQCAAKGLGKLVGANKFCEGRKKVQVFLPQPVYTQPEARQDSGTINTIFFNRYSLVLTVRGKLVEERASLAGAVIYDPIFSNADSLIFVILVHAVPADAFRRDNLDYEVGRAYDAVGGDSMAVYIGEKNEVGFTGRAVGP